MSEIKRKSFKINALEKRLMLDASLGALASTVVMAEDTAASGPQILDSDVSVTGSTTDFDGLSLDVSTTGGTDDQLSINNEGSGASQIGFDGTNISYEGVVVGTLSSNGSNGSNLTIDLNANANKAAIDRLIENITYENNSDNPVQDRTLNFALDGGNLFSEDMTVTIVAQNDDPVIDTNAGLTVNEGSTTTITATELGISDPDNTDNEVTITITSAVTNGRLELSTNAGVSITSFILDDLNSGRVQYVHDGSDTLSDSFDFDVDDGTATLTTDTFNISVNAVNDAPILVDNEGADVFEGFSTDIGGTEVPTKFGNEILRRSSAGEFGTFETLIDSGSTQMSLVFTTGASISNGVPGEVLFETGGSGRGIGLFINNQNELAFHAGNAQFAPRLTSPIALATNTQYAVVMEIDQTNNEIRMHYAQAGDFTWFEFERTAEATLTGWTGDNSGSNGSGLGQVGNGSYGGFTGSSSGQTNFQGSLDSDFVITRFPTGGTIIENTNLVTTDVDTTSVNLIYTITADAAFGSITNNGVDIGLGDTFTQADLDAGLIDYSHGGGATGDDNFIFSVSDGTTTITNQTYSLNVISGNTAPTITVDPLTIAEDASNTDNVGYVVATDPDTIGGQVLTWSIQGGTGAGIFDIDASTGLVTVLDNSTLDYETTTSYTLIVRVTDDAGAPLFDEETITINIQDVYEGTAPTFTAWGPFNVDENSGNNTVVGTVTTTDAEGDGVSYSIVGGNSNSAFKIDNNGIIRVNGSGKLDFELDNSYSLTVRATDDSVDNLTSQRTVTININDLNEGPTLQIGAVIETIDPTVSFNSDNNNFYKYINHNTNFNNALAQSALQTLNGANGHMVTITSATENSFVDGILGSHIWLAASDADVEGEWKWVAGPEEGSVFSIGGTAQSGFYEKWSGSEPNSGASANYAYMNTNSNWYDQNGGNRRYVVEWESFDVINNRDYSLNYSGVNGSDISNGTSLGFLLGGDDDGDTITYSITAGNGDGIFEVDANTGELRIFDSTNINTSITTDFTLTIRVDDGSGAFDTKDIDVNFNQLFSITQNNTLTAAEAGTTAITSADLQVTDSDSAASDLVYSITTQPSHGQLELTTAPGAGINSFTQDDIDNNRLVFVSNGDEDATDSFVFSVTDGATTVAGQNFDINVTSTNDAPTINVNTGASVAEGGNRIITAAMLNSLDADDADTGLTFTASNYTNGHIEVNGIIQNTFTQDDINNNLVVFIHDGAETNGSFDVSLADGGEDGAGADTATFTLTKTDVNDAPLVTTNTGTSVVEGATTTITTAILNATDPDDSGTGITYTLSNIQNGRVELSTNPGVPIISFTQDDLNNNRIIFRHDGNEGDARFNVTVADGGEDGAGTDTATVNLTKIAVNDAPTVLRNLGTSVNQNSIVVLKNAVLSAADTDDVATGITFTTSNFSGGQLELLANPNVAITTFTQDDIDNSRIVFRHSGPPVPASFDFVIADGGEDGAGTASGTFNLTVDNTNDAPNITTNSSPTMDEGATLIITTTMLDSFDPDDFGTGLTWTASNLSNGIIQVNGVTQNTFTQADLDAGLVTFIHDDSETTTAGFDIQVADGGEDGAASDSGSFSISVTPVNEQATLVVNDGDPNVLDLHDYTFDSYSASPGQDIGGTLTVSADGGTVTFTNANMWKEIATPYTLTANTVLSFEFFADTAWEIQGIGFENSNGDFNFLGYELFGTQNWNLNDSQRGYQAGDGWVRYDITIGADFAPTSAITTMVFAVDNDANLTGNTAFRNIGFYESDQIVSVNEGGTFNITNAHINSIDVDDSGVGLAYTASNVTNGHIEVNGAAQNTFTQDDIDNNRVVFIHDGSDTLSAGFDISLEDGGENGTVAVTDTFTIIVNSGDDAPLAATNNGMSTNEGATTTLTAAMLTTSDVDTEPRNVTFDVTGALANGRLELSTNAGVAINSFTLADIQNGIVRYVHNGGESIADNFDFTVTDGTSTLSADTFNITVTPVNDAPVITGDLAMTVVEGANVTVALADLGFTDPDDIATGVTFTVSNLSNGIIQVNGVTQNTFTADDITNNLVVFIHDDSETTTAGFDISLADGGEDSAAADTASMSITVTPVDDAPATATNNGMTTDEGSTTTLTAAMLTTSDGDTLPQNVVFNITNALGNGRLELSTNAGVAINSFTLQDIQNGVVRYVHDGSETTSDSFDFTVTDGTSTLPADTFSITVTPVNEAVVLATNTGTNITESDLTMITNVMLNSTDVDDTATGITYSVTSISNGWVELTTKSGYPVTSFTQADIDNNRVVFRHDGSGAATASFDFSVVDGGEDSASASTGTFSLNVNTAVNEAPVLVISDGTPTTIDFTGTTIDPYDPSGVGDGQAGTPTDYLVSDDGSVLTIYGNAWKRIPLATTLTADTVITFDFRSTKEGEIHGFGFDTDSNYSNGHFAYELFGTDTSAGFNQAYNSYSLGDGWTRFEIPVGADFTGAVNNLFFVADDDNGANSDAISQFRNVSIYEADPTVTVVEGNSVTITNNYLNAIDTDDSATGLTYTASNLTNGYIEVNGVTQNTFTQDDIDNNLVVFVHDDSETTSASFDITLADGGENSAAAATGTFNLTVTPVNEAPSITGDLTMSMNEGASATVTAADLGFSDVDDIATGVTYTASNLSNGIIQVSGVTQNTFTADDIINNRVAFIHDGGETTSSGFDISLVDGGEDSTGADTASMSITVARVNDDPSAVSLSATNIHESEHAGTVIGTLSTTDVDLPGDTFTYSILSDPDNKFTIVGNELRLNNVLDYEIDTQHSVTIQTNDGNGGTTNQIFTINILDNTAPTDIAIDEDTIVENSAIGTVIGTLSATDTDPNESMNYTLMTNPGGMFTIVGNQLMVDGTIDYEGFAFADVQIQALDIDGNTFDQTIRIMIDNLDEFTGDIVTLDTDVFDADGGQNNGDNDFNGFNKREIFRVGEILEPLKKFARSGILGATLNGDSFQSQAFYGDNIQMIRENTTIIVQGFLDGDIDYETLMILSNAFAGDLPGVQELQELSNPDNVAEEGEEFKTPQEILREALLQLQQADENGDDDSEDGEDDGFASLDKDFQSILTYHQQKQAALREALQN